jgi:hypothetical protein
MFNCEGCVSAFLNSYLKKLRKKAALKVHSIAVHIKTVNIFTAG